ncbi:LysR family transcriptional regulator [Salmonella enterica subsp. enterica serovar Kentucky]|nr:LysR family transcriptional regulator [Salmonella enterica subsp. enterica serovar Kentucky]
MEIRQLEYFVSASLLGNLTRVAERHFVSQPNITIAIKKLETELGVTLFDRKKNKLVLTEEGMFFLQKIEPILIALKNSVAEMKDYRNENGGIVTLGIPPMISLFLFSPLFKHFREIYPEMELSLVEEGTFGLHDKLSAGELDLAIVIINDCPKELVTVPLMTQQHVVCMSGKHPLAKKDSIDWEDLQYEPLILMKKDSWHRKTIIEECTKRGIHTHIFLSSNRIQTNIDLVAKNEGISFILDAVDLKAEKVITKAMTEPTYVTIGLAWKKDKYLSYATRALIKFIEDYIKEHFTIK